MTIWRDLVHACRSLAKSRAFTFVCVLSLGIGMAPVIGIQYWARALTTPPRGVETATLVELVTTRVGPRGPSDKWSYPDFIDLRDAATGMAVTGWVRGSTDVTAPDSGTTTARAMFVSANYFRTIGVGLARGPGLQDTADPVVVVGYQFWQSRLASDPDIVGKTLTLNGVPHVVAGIAADGFGGHLPLQDAEVFLPIARHPNLLGDGTRRFDRSRGWLRVHGRLSPGVTGAQARAAVSSFTAQLAKEYPATNASTAGVALPYHTVGNIDGEDLRIVLTLWNVLTAIPLIVVCLNISGMVQVRSAMRERELSIRQAIGASRRQLIQFLLAESAVLAVLGGTLASLVLFNLPPLVSWWVGEPMGELDQVLRVDFRMIAVSAGLCFVTSLLFGWLPALRFSRPVIVTVLKDETGGGGRRAGRVHRVTSALQVAIAVPLLVLSAMSLERVRATLGADLGFAVETLYAAPVELRGGTGDQLRSLRENLARASGVASVTVADGLPLDFRYRTSRISTQTDAAVAQITRVGDGYLDTMGIALAAGRRFTNDDGPGAPLVTIVSKTLADALFPDGDAIGRQLSYEVGAGDDIKTRALTIVGVAVDFPTAQISTDREQLLLPLAQHPDGQPTLMLIARAAPGEPPAKLQAALENTVREVNRTFDRRSIVTGVSLREATIADFLNQSTLAGVSGGVALLLAALGIYGVVGLMVTSRMREMAVRVTLGASRSRVIGMILFDVIKLVAPGVAAGTLITAGINRLAGGVTVSAVEPVAYFVGAAIALLTAVLAGLAPARRAAAVEPMVAMRST